MIVALFERVETGEEMMERLEEDMAWRGITSLNTSSHPIPSHPIPSHSSHPMT